MDFLLSACSVFFLITIDCISNLYSKADPSNNFVNAASTVTSFTFSVTFCIVFN